MDEKAAEKQQPTGQQQQQHHSMIHSAALRNRLPTLAEVLARRTLPPVDLYCFYLYLQREGSEDSLDFWLDVQQHENLCRAYFKDLKKGGRSVRDDWPGYYREARQRGSIYNRLTGVADDPSSDGGHNQYDEEQTGVALGGPSADPFDEKNAADVGGGEEGQEEQQPRDSTGGPRFPGDPDHLAAQQQQQQQATTSQDGGGGANAARRAFLSKRASLAPTIIARDAPITRTDLVASAERIYARYLLPGSEKEIYLPAQLRIESFPISSNSVPQAEDEEQQRALARVPDMFHAQKEYVFRTMEADVFPRFLRSKAFGNLTPISALVRLSLGLLALWAALATGFAFIFLEVARLKRCWVILPFSVAVLLLFSHQYELDPLLVFALQSETTPFHLIRIREPYVRRLLLSRAIGVLFLVALVTAALSCLFIFVPGHRL